MSECKLDHTTPPSQDALDRPIRCRHCGSPIPASSALHSEGADYIRHFCGEDCLARWCSEDPGSRTAAARAPRTTS